MNFRSVLVLKPDRFDGEMLCQIVRELLPEVGCELAGSTAAAGDWLKVAPVDMLLSSAPMDDEGFSWLTRIAGEGKLARKTLIVTNRREPGLLDALRRLRICGVFDTATDGRADFLLALRDVDRGCSYWSRSVIETIHQECLSPHSPIRKLTPAERRVLAVIADGNDDTNAGLVLGLRPSTVSSVRKAIHRKLNVQHRGELMRLGRIYGFVAPIPSRISK